MQNSASANVGHKSHRGHPSPQPTGLRAWAGGPGWGMQCPESPETVVRGVLWAPRLAPCPLWVLSPASLRHQWAQNKGCGLWGGRWASRGQDAEGAVWGRGRLWSWSVGPAPYLDAVLSHPPGARQLPQEGRRAPIHTWFVPKPR